MQDITRRYIIVGLVWLIAGMIFGVWLGASEHLTYANSHAHMNLLGFVVSTLFGLLYWAFPGMARSSLAMWQFIIYELGVLLLIIGKVMLDGSNQPNVFLFIGSIVTIIGTALMLYIFAAKSGKAAAV